MTYALSGGAAAAAALGLGGFHVGAGGGAASSALGPAGPAPGGGAPGAAAGTPHHVSNEPLCELSLCICLARRLPVPVLTRAVRSTFVPGEYPGSIEALYGGTPDEAPPQFYTDPDVFRSLHGGMADLAVPSWAGSPEEFVRVHRWVGLGRPMAMNVDGHGASQFSYAAGTAVGLRMRLRMRTHPSPTQTQGRP
jgi:hypothetical protein